MRAITSVRLAVIIALLLGLVGTVATPVRAGMPTQPPLSTVTFTFTATSTTGQYDYSATTANGEAIGSFSIAVYSGTTCTGYTRAVDSRVQSTPSPLQGIFDANAGEQSVKLAAGPADQSSFQYSTCYPVTGTSNPSPSSAPPSMGATFAFGPGVDLGSFTYSARTAGDAPADFFTAAASTDAECGTVSRFVDDRAPTGGVASPITGIYRSITGEQSFFMFLETASGALVESPCYRLDGSSPSPSPSASVRPSASASVRPSASASVRPSASVSVRPSASPSIRPSPSATVAPTRPPRTPVVTPTPTVRPTATVAPTRPPRPTATPTVTATPRPTVTPRPTRPPRG